MSGQKTMHELELNEYITHFDDMKMEVCCFILRVPGGWIYNFCDSKAAASVFVPFSSEFEDTGKKYSVDIMDD